MSVCLKKIYENLVSEKNKSAIAAASYSAEKHHVKIFLIGGIVRDLILNDLFNPMQNFEDSTQKIKDIDIVTESDAIDFCKILEKEIPCKILSIQENLRTAKVKFENGAKIDFASTREEVYSKPGNLPLAFNFGCPLKADVKRRDFTINTLALNLTNSKKFMLTDYFCGFEDIKNKKIRVLHDNSFLEDPSRIIRALKFKERFNFDIEQKTLSLMHNYLENINPSIPLERIKNEFIQYFSINNPNLYNKVIETKAYKLLSDNPFINFDKNVLQELHFYNLFNKDDLRLIYMLLLIINSDYSKRKLNLTSYEKKVIEEVKNLIGNFPIDINNKSLIYRLFNKKNNLSAAIYYIMTKDKSVKRYLNELKDIKTEIKGEDLIKIGLKPSPHFKELFEKILEEKLNGRLITKEEEIEFVKKLQKKRSN